MTKSNNTQGSSYEILNTLGKRLNFSTEVYKRRSEGWGVPMVYSNVQMECNAYCF